MGSAGGAFGAFGSVGVAEGYPAVPAGGYPAGGCWASCACATGRLAMPETNMPATNDANPVESFRNIMLGSFLRGRGADGQLE